MRTATRRATVYGGNRSIPAPEAPVPVAGVELLVNGGFESWASATNADNWTETVAGATTVNQESSDKYAGSYACRVDVDGSQSAFTISQGVAATTGAWLAMSFYARASVASTPISFRTGAMGLRTESIAAAWTPTPYVYTNYLPNTSSNFAFDRAGGSAGRSIYLDNVSVRPLTLSSLFSTRPYASANCDISVAVTRTAGTQAGISARVDSAASPANFLIAYLDGSGNVKVDKCVSGTYTNVISGAVTYGAGRILRLVCNGNNVSAYYNGTQVGSTTAVADAGITGNKNHGLFSTYASNSFSGYVAA